MDDIDEDYQELIHLADALHTVSEILNECVDKIINREMSRKLHDQTIKKMLEDSGHL